MKIAVHIFLILAAMFILVPPSNAQVVFDGNQTGLPPFGSFHGSDFESVSLSNGNLHVEIPILNLSQRGGNGGSFKYVYDTQGWNIVWIPVARGNPLAPGYYVVNPNNDDQGWRLADVASRTAWGYNYDYTIVQCDTIPPYNSYSLYSNYTVKDSRGTRHQVPLRKEGNGTQAVCLGQVLSAPTLDGSGFVAQLASSGPGMASVKAPGGEQNNADANGNTWSSNPLLDTLGRTPYIFYSAPNITYTTPLNQTIQGPAYSTMTIKDSGGTDRVFRIDYLARDIASNFCPLVIPSKNCVESGNFARLLISKITLSSIDGTSKFFQFTWDGGAAAYGIGNLTRIDLPTGGYVSYAYISRAFRSPLEGRNLPYSGRGVVTQRTVNDGTQSSTWLYSGGTITSPSYGGIQNQEVHSFTNQANGLLLGSIVESQVQYYAGSSTSGTLLRTVTKDYTAEPDPVTGDGANVRQIRETTTLDNGLVSKVETDYETFTYTFLNTFGYCTTCTATRLNVTERREYAYGSGAAGSLVRKTDYTFLHTSNQPYIDRNIINRVKLVSIYDGSSILQAQTQNDYDIYNYPDMGVMQPSNAVQHDATNYGTAFTYRGNITAIKRWRNTDGAWLETRHQYDDAGNILKTRDPPSHFTNFGYTDNWANPTCAAAGQAKAFVKSVTNALTQTTIQSYNSCTGTVAASTDPNNQPTTFTYDFRNRPAIMNLPDGGQVSNDYDETNRVVTMKRKLTSLASIYSRVSYDVLGRVTQSQLCEDGTPACATSIKTDTSYDALGRRGTVSNPYRTANDPGPTNGVTTSQYDALNRVITLIPPDGTSSTNNVSTVFAGNCTTVTDQAGKKRKSCSDALGRLIQVFEDPAASNYETDYTYDTLDNLTRVDQKGNDPNSANWRTRTFTYNSLSQLLTAANPESGVITYTYDNDGNVQTKTAPAPNQTGAAMVTTTFAYDVLHRLTQKSYSDTTPVVKYGYDALALTGCATPPPTLTDPYPNGRRTSMCDGAGAESWSHDQMGRPVADARTTNGISKNMAYTYNLDGSFATLTYPSGRTITYSPDAAGRLVSAVDSTGPINYATGALYSPAGALASFANSASIVSTYFYNNRLQPCRISVKNTGAAPSSCTDAVTGNVLDFSYNFSLGSSDNGNVTAITNNRDTTRSQTFTYDPLNRVATAQTTSTFATSPAHCWGEAYFYDNLSTVGGAWGNLTRIAPVSSAYTSCTQESGLSITSANNNQISGFCYDAAGNLLAQSAPPCPVPTYRYNAENKMTLTAGVTYTYDGDGKRVQKSSGKLYWYGMGSDPLDETDLTGSTTNASFSEYIFFGGKRIARRDSSNNVNYYFADHLGTARVSTNSSGSTCYDADFYPFGGERIVTDTCDSAYKFTGKERDSESGLDNFGARYNSSSLGRFMSPDPINLTARRLVNPANTLNKYVYGGNNPLLYVDPDGLDITVFYRQGQFGNPADYGHILIAATNQQTGKVKFLDFYPQGSKTVLNQNMTAERLNQHAAITIQTTPEVAQKVIDFIEKLEKNTPEFAALSNNCTTICKEAMAMVGIDFPGGIFPDDLWSALYAQYSNEALSDREQLGNPFFAPLPRYQPGVDFGRTSFLPRGSGFSVFDLFSLMLRSQSHKGTACVTTQGPKGPETTCEPN